MSLSSTAQSASITEAAVAGVFLIGYGAYWVFRAPKTIDTDTKIRRYGVYVSIMLSAAFLMVMGILQSVRNNLVFVLRNGATFPIGYTSCTELLVNQGICSNVARTSFYGIVFVLGSFGWQYLMQWKANTTVSHIFGTILFIFGIQQFYLYKDNGWEWVAVAFFALGALIVIATHIVSSWYSKSKSKHNTMIDKSNYTPIRKDMGIHSPIGNSSPANALNYEYSTPEWWINIIGGPLLLVCYALFPALGPAAGNFWTYGTESWIYTSLDIVFFLILGGVKMYFFSIKGPMEIKQLQSKMPLNSQ